MAAASPLTLITPKSRKLQTFKTSASSSPQHCSTNPITNVKKQIIQMGVGLLAASAVATAPLEAEATRIEYYATFAEPSCELNFVRSGLGYCDVAVGSGAEVPFAELINIRTGKDISQVMFDQREQILLKDVPNIKATAMEAQQAPTRLANILRIWDARKKIHYTARFADGIVFDSSYKRGRPLTMRLGLGKVIKGLDQGILGGGGVPPMQLGGKRKLQIPPHLAYGPEPAGCFSGDCNIPGNATLLYDIKFVEVYKGNRK